MTDKTKHNLRTGVGLFIAEWTVLLGLAFIIQAWRIFSHGDSPYTLARISEHFKQIAVPVYIWLAAVVVGGILCWVIPEKEAKAKPYIELKYTLARLGKRLPADTEEMKKWQKQRFIAAVICALVALGCVVVSLVYLIADVKLFAKSGFLAEHVEAERLVHALLWFIAALAVSVGTAYFMQSRYKKEITAVKTAVAENARKGIKTQAKEEKATWLTKLKAKCAFTQSKWFLLGIRAAVGVVAVAFIITGIFNGGVLAVLEKGVKLCMQCIGIG